MVIAHAYTTRSFITFEVFTLPFPAAHAHERQKERAAKGQPGDDVPYLLARTIRSNIQYNAVIALKAKGTLLARTIRSNIQYNAVIALKAKGTGNQCKRGACMERAMSMFCGKNGEGIPREVLLALARY